MGFREGMPKQRRRVKMKLYEECFTGPEAVKWLHDYLQTSGDFGTVSKQQVRLAVFSKMQKCRVLNESCSCKGHCFWFSACLR